MRRRLVHFILSATLLVPPPALAQSRPSRSAAPRGAPTDYSSHFGSDTWKALLKEQAINLNPAVLDRVVSQYNTSSLATRNYVVSEILGLDSSFEILRKKFEGQIYAFLGRGFLIDYYKAESKLYETFQRFRVLMTLARNGYWDLVAIEQRSFLRSLIELATYVQKGSSHSQAEKSQFLIDVIEQMFVSAIEGTKSMSIGEKTRFKESLEKVALELVQQDQMRWVYLFKRLSTSISSLVTMGVFSGATAVVYSVLVFFVSLAIYITGSVPEFIANDSLYSSTAYKCVAAGGAILGGVLRQKYDVPLFCAVRKAQWFRESGYRCQKLLHEQGLSGDKK